MSARRHSISLRTASVFAEVLADLSCLKRLILSLIFCFNESLIGGKDVQVDTCFATIKRWGMQFFGSIGAENAQEESGEVFVYS